MVMSKSHTWEMDYKHEERMDVTEELNDLVGIYIESIEQIKEEEQDKLRTLIHYMKSYLESWDDLRNTEVKLARLKNKIVRAQEEE